MDIKITLEYNHYATDGKTFKKDDKFIGVNYEKFKEGNNAESGGGSPCNNRAEVMKVLKRVTKGISDKDVELIDKTDKHITKGELFGQDLSKWLK